MTTGMSTLSMILRGTPRSGVAVNQDSVGRNPRSERYGADEIGLNDQVDAARDHADQEQSLEHVADIHADRRITQETVKFVGRDQTPPEGHRADRHQSGSAITVCNDFTILRPGRRYLHISLTDPLKRYLNRRVSRRKPGTPVRGKLLGTRGSTQIR